MSLIGRALGLTPRAGANFNDESIWTTYGGSSYVSQAGIRIDTETALKISTVWAGVHLIANSIGMLPMGIFQRLPRGRREAPEHPLWDVLHTQPNRSQTAGQFKAMLTSHALLRGDAIARIVPGPRGPVDQLIPIHPDRVTIEQMDDYSLRYRIKPKNEVGRDEVLLDDEVFHLQGLSLDGVTGVSFIKYGAESLGLSKAGEGYAGRVFRNDSTPRGVLKVKKRLSDDAARRMKTDWEALHSGQNQHRIAVLEEETDFQGISISPEDTQLLASREYQDVDIARYLGIPLFLLQIMTKSTSWGSGISEMWQAFIATGLGDWATRWEQCIARDLIIAPYRYYVKINLNALVRGDIEKRFAAYNTGIVAGFMTRNEARELEDWNPIDGLDEPLRPLNMQEGGSVGDRPEQVGGSVGDRPEQVGGSVGDRPEQVVDRAAAHYRLLVEESAGRVVRKELAAVTTAARRAREDFATFEAEVREFYREHGAFVAQTMRMDAQAATGYVGEQATKVLSFGTPCQPLELAECAERLAQLATNGSVGDRHERGGSVGDRPERGGTGGSVGDRPERR